MQTYFIFLDIFLRTKTLVHYNAEGKYKFTLGILQGWTLDFKNWLVGKSVSGHHPCASLAIPSYQAGPKASRSFENLYLPSAKEAHLWWTFSRNYDSRYRAWISTDACEPSFMTEIAICHCVTIARSAEMG